MFFQLKECSTAELVVFYIIIMSIGYWSDTSVKHCLFVVRIIIRITYVSILCLSDVTGTPP